MQAEANLARMAEQNKQLQSMAQAAAAERDEALERCDTMLAHLQELQSRYQVSIC
jgi:hypothetical protein